MDYKKSQNPHHYNIMLKKIIPINLRKTQSNPFSSNKNSFFG